MNEQVIFGLFCIMSVIGVFSLLFVVSEAIFNLIYKYIPAVAERWDRFCESLPDWDDEESDEYARVYRKSYQNESEE